MLGENLNNIMDSKASNIAWQNIITNNHKLSKQWVWLGIFALAVAGILSIMLVLARMPFINSLMPKAMAFKTILIVHVNLSILVWLLAIIASIWCKYVHKSLYFMVNQLNYIAWVGVASMIISVFVADSVAVSNNYVPILHNLPFITGLACFTSSIFCLSLIIFISYLFNYLAVEDRLLILASSSFLVITIALCLYMSYLGLDIHTNKYTSDLYFYYEMLFWGGGHILQFLYSQMISYVWLILAYQTYQFNKLHKNLYASCFILNCLFIIPAIGLYWLVHIDDGFYTEFFTIHMRYFGGIVPISVMMLIIWQAYCNKNYRVANIVDEHWSDYCRAALLTSISIFMAGGLMGLCIAGTNVIIPAHYHGSIVGISIGFMGYTYHYIAMNYNCCSLANDIAVKRQATQQIIIYGIGQFVHISGLFMAGGYGALRKTPGEEIALKAKIGMMIMGLGGLVAIIGGLMFIVICVKTCNIFKTNNQQQINSKN